MRSLFTRPRIIGRGRDSNGRIRRRGSEVLELALLLLPLAMLIFGGIEFGFFFFLQHTVQAAAREGARAYVPLGAQTVAAAQAKANAVLTGALLKPASYTVSVANDGTNVTVTVSADWSQVGVKLMKFITKQKISGTAVMRLEKET